MHTFKGPDWEPIVEAQNRNFNLLKKATNNSTQQKPAATTTTYKFTTTTPPFYRTISITIKLQLAAAARRRGYCMHAVVALAPRVNVKIRWMYVGVKSSRPMWQLETDNSTHETTRPLWQLRLKISRPTRQLDLRDNSTHKKINPRDSSTHETTRPPVTSNTASYLRITNRGR